MDRVDLRPGLLLPQLEHHLANCDRFVPVITRDYLDGPIASREAEQAIRRTIFKRDLGIIPIVVEGEAHDYSGFLAGYVMMPLDCASSEEEFYKAFEPIAEFILRDPF